MTRHRCLAALPMSQLGLLAFTLAVSAWASGDEFGDRLASAAIDRTRQTVRYDGSYRSIPYPNGDISADTGVCTDVIVRSYRALGVDLQRLVHEDMQLQFDAYPSLRIWGLTRTDSNIDHRRVANLQTFFERHGAVLPLATDSADYNPGDLVTWNLPGNLPHIGIVTNRSANGGKRPLIAHNMGRGPELQDMLFDFPITGHYRFAVNTVPES